MTVGTGGDDGMDGRSLDFTLGEIKSELGALRRSVDGQTQALNTVSNSLNSLDNRVTALETQNKSKIGWPAMLGALAALVAVLGFGLFVLDRLYGK